MQLNLSTFDDGKVNFTVPEQVLSFSGLFSSDHSIVVLNMGMFELVVLGYHLSPGRRGARFCHADSAGRMDLLERLRKNWVRLRKISSQITENIK